MRFSPLLLFVFTGWFQPGLWAQDLVFPLFPEGAPCLSGLTDSSVFISDIGTLIRQVEQPEIHYFRPVSRSSGGSAILIIPGGGYVVEAWDIEGVDIAKRMSAEGFHAFVLKHRLPHNATESCKSQVALEDAQRGIQSIRLLADSLKIDRDRVAVMGFSAGGHLAASASVHFLEADSTAFPAAAAYSSRPDLSLPIYAVLSMDSGEVTHRGSMHALLGKNPDPGIRRYFNLPQQVHPNVAPTFLVHATDDAGVLPENSIRYYQALVANKVPASLHIFSQGGHGFGAATHLKTPVSNWLELAIAWMRSNGF